MRYCPSCSCSILVIASFLLMLFIPSSLYATEKQDFSGSKSCISCHAKFYELWATSRHGTALQPFSTAIAKQLTAQTSPIQIREATFQFIQDNGEWVIKERTFQKITTHPIYYVLGGKYVYYFLTRLERGRLQTLPIAYDFSKKEWFDMAASGVRHAGDAPVSWRDQTYTFNTSCYGCHVSQTSINYSAETDSYSTTWKEAGINCETCHGPSADHVAVCTDAPKGTTPDDLKILGGKGKFSIQQNTDACAPCHAQMTPISTGFVPGESFYDHYDLTALEDQDWYPDGRDLGENYTLNTWKLSPCVQSGRLGCMHCHTSSGRFIQVQHPNKACSPCHEEKVQTPEVHTMHKPDSAGSLCISCHMVKTQFARMDRSDHSMLPPTPAATIKFGSPNACNVCHTDKDATWADNYVRKWRKRDYQKPILHRASLIKAARKQNWKQLPNILTYINNPNSNEIFVASLIRLLRSCPSAEKWPAISKTTRHPSPLVRSAACTILADWNHHDSVALLATATGDPVRLVRIRAAASLAGKPYAVAEGTLNQQISNATEEYLEALYTRPDVWTTHYNLGNYYRKTKQHTKAISAYTKANELAPQAIAPMVNCAILHGNLGDLAKANTLLSRAHTLAPKNMTVLYNLGLVEAERGRFNAAEQHLRTVLTAHPDFERAAANLASIVSQRSSHEAIPFAQKAYKLNPTPANAFALAYYLKQAGEKEAATSVLKASAEQWPAYTDTYILLYELAETDEEQQSVLNSIQEVLKNKQLQPEKKARLNSILQQIIG